MSDLQGTASGLTATVVHYADRVELVRAGPLSQLATGVPDRVVIPITDIRRVVFSHADDVATGYVRFVRDGDPTDRAAEGQTTMADRARAEDTVVFGQTTAAAFERVRDRVRATLLDHADQQAVRAHRAALLAGEISEQQFQQRLDDVRAGAT